MLDGKGVNDSQRLAEKCVMILKLLSGVRGSAAVRFKCCATCRNKRKRRGNKTAYLQITGSSPGSTLRCKSPGE